MKTNERKILNRMKKNLQGRVRLHKVILFGSRARGDAQHDSDMDVLIVLDEPISRQSRKIISHCAWETGFEAGIVIVPVVVSRNGWENGPERYSLLAMAVREEGIPI